MKTGWLTGIMADGRIPRSVLVSVDSVYLYFRFYYFELLFLVRNEYCSVAHEQQCTEKGNLYRLLHYV